jgi:hypothetical protein
MNLFYMFDSGIKSLVINWHLRPQPSTRATLGSRVPAGLMMALRGDGPAGRQDANLPKNAFR